MQYGTISGPQHVVLPTGSRHRYIDRKIIWAEGGSSMVVSNEADVSDF